MATLSQMRDAICSEYSVSPMRMKALSQALSAAGLRTDGGSGRGAAQMSGLDVATHAISVMLDVPTKDAPDVVREIVTMTLANGSWMRDDNMMWEYSAASSTSPMMKMLAAAHRPDAAFPAPDSLGDLLGKWVDGTLDPKLGTYIDGTTTLELSNAGPHARFVYQGEQDSVVLIYKPEGAIIPKRALWERKLLVTGAVFKRLHEICHNQST